MQLHNRAKYRSGSGQIVVEKWSKFNVGISIIWIMDLTYQLQCPLKAAIFFTNDVDSQRWYLYYLDVLLWKSPCEKSEIVQLLVNFNKFSQLNFPTTFVSQSQHSEMYIIIKWTVYMVVQILLPINANHHYAKTPR